MQTNRPVNADAREDAVSVSAAFSKALEQMMLNCLKDLQTGELSSAR